MLPEPIRQDLRKVAFAVERALQGDRRVAGELQEWAAAYASAGGVGEIPRLADVVSDLIRVLQERETGPERQAAELAEQNEKLKAALKAAEAWQRELADLHEVANAITSRLDLDELVLVLEEKTRSLLAADACSLMLHDHARGRLRIIGPRLQIVPQTVACEHADLCDVEAAHAATTGEPRCYNNVPNSRYCRYRELISGEGVHHMLSVPMRSQDRLVGAINAFRIAKRPFDAADERKLSIMASTAAIALENAEAYRRERNIADKLQRGIQPGCAARLPGFSIGCDYVPASSEARVGGDIHDVVDLGDGKVGVAIADISGKGVDAAVYTAMVRFTLRGLMLADLSPGVVLERLNDAVCSFVPEDIFVTLFYGVLDTRSREMVYANAGHDQPLVYVSRHGCCLECDVTGRALGMVGGDSYATRRLCFQPGDMIVMYTDGITEARRNHEFFGSVRLRDIIVGRASYSAQQVVDAILAEVQSFSPDGLHDDAALLVVKTLTV